MTAIKEEINLVKRRGKKSRTKIVKERSNFNQKQKSKKEVMKLKNFSRKKNNKIETPKRKKKKKKIKKIFYRNVEFQERN